MPRVFPVLLVVLAACASGLPLEDGRDDDLPGAAAKADTGGLEEETPEAYGVLRVANEATAEALVHDAGLSDRAATSIVTHRSYDSLAELDAVTHVGPVAFARLLAYAKSLGWVGPLTVLGATLDDARCPEVRVRLSRPVSRAQAEVATRLLAGEDARSLTVTVEGADIVIRPDELLPTFTVEIGQEIGLAAPFRADFTAAAPAATSLRPLAPRDGERGVPVDGELVVLVCGAIDPMTARLVTGSTAVAGIAHLDGSSHLIFRPSSELLRDTDYVLEIGGARAASFRTMDLGAAQVARTDYSWQEWTRTEGRLNARGEAIVANAVGGAVKVRRFDGHAWIHETISATGGEKTLRDVALGDGGDAVVTWSNGVAVWQNVYHPSSGWEGERQLLADGASLGAGVDAAGDVIVLTGDRTAAYLSRNGAPGEKVSDARDAHLVAGRMLVTGQTTALWDGRSFGPRRTLPAVAPSIFLGDGGDATAAWLVYGKLHVSTARAGGAWTPPRVVSRFTVEAFKLTAGAIAYRVQATPERVAVRRIGSDGTLGPEHLTARGHGVTTSAPTAIATTAGGRVLLVGDSYDEQFAELQGDGVSRWSALPRLDDGEAYEIHDVVRFEGGLRVFLEIWHHGQVSGGAAIVDVR